MQANEVQDFRLVELARRLANVVRPGVIAEADDSAAAVRVRYAEETEAVTGWLPWLAARAGGDTIWWAPEVGEQVLILAPSGEISNGIVLGALYSDKRQAPTSDPDKHLVRYSDGAEIEYDREAHRLRAVLPSGGAAEISAPEGVTITGDVMVTGDVTVDGGVDASGDITADGDIAADGNVEAGGEVEDKLGAMAEMRTTYNTHTHGVPPGVVTPPPNQRMT